MGAILHLVLTAHLLTTTQPFSREPLASAAGIPGDTQSAFDKSLVGVPGIDRVSLLRYLQGLGLSPGDRQRIDQLIDELGSDHFRVRERAMRELRLEKAAALVLLRKALDDPNQERRRRAEMCSVLLEGKSDPARAEAALRLMAAWRPPGATAAVLAYLPFANEDALVDQALATLLDLGVGDAETLTESLTADPALQRAAAALVLGYHGDTDRQLRMRGCLADPAPIVRLGAALGLAGRGDRTAAAALVDLVGEPAPVGWKAERGLARLAGPSGPHVGWANQPETRSLCQAAWRSWLLSESRKLMFDPARVLDANRQAQDIAQKFFDVLARGRLDDLKRLTATPFFLGGPLVLRNQDEFDRVFASAFEEQRPHTRPFRMQILHTMRGENYAAPESERAFLAENSLGTIRVVVVKGVVSDQKEEDGAVLVRFQEGRAKIMGIGHVK